MRRNAFGEVYCNTADEARPIIGEHGSVYAPECDFCEPEGNFGATCEIACDVTGELVCYIEAPTLAAVHAIVQELEIEVL